MCCYTNERDCRDIFVRDVTRNLVEPRFIHGGEVGKGALPAIPPLPRGPDAVPDFKSFHVCTGGDDFAGEVAAEDVGEIQIRRDSATADVEVDWVYIDGSDFN